MEQRASAAERPRALEQAVDALAAHFWQWATPWIN
jgi:hypothetical protein